jgi:hemoglobin-like flavoprotein
MSFLGNQIVNMMVNKIKANNPRLTPYLDEIQNNGNPSEVLRKAIQNGAITRQQWNQAKPLLNKYGTQMGINVSPEDINNIEQAFNTPTQNNNPIHKGFRF